MRKLSVKFMGDLVNSDGVLHPILTRVKKDHTLMLAIWASPEKVDTEKGRIR